MASHRARKHDSCAHENCGSRRFHVGEDGFTYCDQGHQQSERGTVIAEDTGEMMLLGRKSRRKDSYAESATSRASSFTGSHAFEHYLLCIQLVLRKQAYWLVTTRKLPDELEILLKDLWALRLQKVQSRVAYESETETEVPSSQVFSSQSESEATTASRSTRRSRRKGKEKVQEGAPSLLNTLALCYIAFLLLRIPMTVADLHKWTSDGQLLYYRAVREIPLGMRERLPPRYQAQLEPQDLLRPSSIHSASLDLLRTFSGELGMTPPRPNVPLILYRWLRELMLPVEMYAASTRLAALLEITFDFFLQTKAATNVNLQYPEVRLMGVVLVATKLLFPLDDTERCTRSPADLSAVRMDWKEWANQNAAQTKNNASDLCLSFGHSFNFGEAECHSSSNDKLDAYLDWYEDNVSSEEVRERGKAGKDEDLRRAMFAMFPTGDRTTGASRAQPAIDNQTLTDKHLRIVQSKLQPRRIDDPRPPEDEVRAVGNNYRRCRNASELSGVTKIFYERAAKLAGSSLDEMVQVVFAIERKIQKLEERLRKESDE